MTTKKLTCIDSLHAQGVRNYIQAHGHSAVLSGRGVITDCSDEQVVETAVGFGLAIIDEPDADDLYLFKELR